MGQLAVDAKSSAIAALPTLLEMLTLRGKVTAIRQQDGAISEQSPYYLLSEACTAERPNYILRGHWGIENRLHWALDVTCNEDQARNRKGHCAENLELLRKLAGWDYGFLISILSQFTKIHMR